MGLPVRQSSTAEFPVADAPGTIRWSVDDLQWEYWDGAAWTPWSSGVGGGGAPTNAEYVTLATNGTLTQERVLTGEVSVISITDGGAGSTVTVGIAAAGVSDAKLAVRGACSVMGHAANSAGTPADISASANGQVLRRRSNVVGFGALAIDELPTTQARAVNFAASPYTVVAGDFILFVDDTAGTVTVNLPAASALPGRQITVTKRSASNSVSVVADGADTINGSASVPLNTQYMSYTFVCPPTGQTDWAII